MKYHLMPRRVSRRGKSFASYEPSKKMRFEALINYLKLNPWANWQLGDYIIHFFNKNPEMLLKLNLVASEPENTEFFLKLFALSKYDLFTILSLVEFYNLNVDGWVFKSMDSSDSRFQFLDPNLRRAYNPNLQDSLKLYLFLKQLEQDGGFWDPEKIKDLDEQSKEKLLQIIRKLIVEEPKINYITADYTAIKTSGKKDHNYFTSLREIPVLETINRIKSQKILSKIGVNEHQIEGPHYRFGTYYFRAIRNVELNIRDIQTSVVGRIAANGKGINEEIAWASMAAEAIERFSASVGIPDWPNCYKTDLDLTSSTMSDLIVRGHQEGFKVLDPNELNLIYPYKNSATYWVKGRDLKGNDVYCIAEAVFHPYILNSPIHRHNTSNGLASGNTLEEAKLHAYYEIIERDSYSRSINSGAYKILVPNEIPEIKQIINAYQKENLVAYIRDVTMELGIPSYRVSLETKDKLNFSAIGTSLNGVEALIRALAELNPFISIGIKENLLIRATPTHLQPGNEFDLQSLPNFSTGAVKDDLKLLENLFELNRFSPLYFDLTVKDIDFPVVHLVIPGWHPYFHCYNNQRFFRAIYSALNSN